MIIEQISNLINYVSDNILRNVYLQNRYILAGIILVVTLILAKFVQFIFSLYLKKFAKKTKTEIDDKLFDKTRKPFFFLILLYGLKLSLNYLDVNGIVLKLIYTLMILMFLIITTRTINILIDSWGKTFAKKTRTNIDDIILPLFHKTIGVILIILAIIWALKIWDVDIAPYLAGVGISGLVLGFALQDSLKNVFGGVSLILDKTFQIGDKIKIESGELGEVFDVGLRSTKIKTYDNEIIIVPNGQLANSRIQNYTKPSSKIRVGVAFGVEYGSDIKKVQNIVLKTIKGMEDVLTDPEPTINFLEMGDFALNFKAYFWVSDWKNSYSKKLEALEKVYDSLNKAKINIPFPTQTIHLDKR